mgnify:CR=1 FL=1
MCLAIPGKVVEVNDDSALIDYGSERRKADISLIVPKTGDYVVVNTGFVIQVVPEEEAIESLKAWRHEIDE